MTFYEKSCCHLTKNTLVSRNISSSLSLTSQNICVESWAGVNHSRFPKNVPSHLSTSRATLLVGAAPKSQSIKKSKASVQNNVKKYNQLVVSSRIISWAQCHKWSVVQPSRKGKQPKSVIQSSHIAHNRVSISLSTIPR